MNVEKLIKRALLASGLLVLLLFIKSIDVNSFQNVRLINWRSFMIVISLTALNVFLKALRWQALIKRIASAEIKTSFSFMSIIAGVAAGSFIPGRLELAKPLLAKTEYKVRLSHSLSALTIERVLDLLSLLLIISVALFFIPLQNYVSKEIIGGLLMLIIIFITIVTFFPSRLTYFSNFLISWLPLRGPWKQKAENFFSLLINNFSILKQKTFLASISILSITANFVEVIRFYLLLQFLGVPASLMISAFVFTAGILVGIITLIPGGVGITEFSTAGLLQTLLGTSPDLLKTAVLLDRFVSYYLLVISGAVILVSYDLLLRKKKKSPQTF